jgi:hypothetical protein
METRDQRLKRWLDSEPSEIFGWMTVWAQNALVPQIKMLAQPNFEEGLFLLTHGFIQAFMENVFGIRGRDGTRTYLKSFVDGKKKQDKFSLIADDMHEMRNVMAHQIYSSVTNEIVFDYRLSTGWAFVQHTLHINPKIYADRFIDGLEGRLHVRVGAVTRLQQVRRKYRFLVRWLDLPTTDPLTVEIRALCDLPSLTALRPAERRLRRSFRARYGV